MDLLDIVYHLVTAKVSTTDYNKIIELVKKHDKEYLFHQGFEEIKAELFAELEK